MPKTQGGFYQYQKDLLLLWSDYEDYRRGDGPEKVLPACKHPDCLYCGPNGVALLQEGAFDNA